MVDGSAGIINCDLWILRGTFQCYSLINDHSNNWVP